MSQRLTKEHENVSPSLNPSHRSTELTTKPREGKFPRPLWERVWVRGIFISNIYEYPRHINKMPVLMGTSKLSSDFSGSDSIILENDAASKA